MILEVGLVGAGVLIATAAMAIGIGGGILWTPLLILAFGLSPQQAIATALFIQVAGMGSGAIAYWRAGLVEKRLSLIFLAAALPGVILGSFVTVSLAQDTVQLALGVMAMMLAMLFVAGNDEYDEAGHYVYERGKVLRITPIPAFFGFIMGFLSLGISEWLIPALRERLKLDMPRAIGTVIPVMFVLAIVASGIHYSLAENIESTYFVWGALGTVIGAQIGARVSQRVNERLLKQSFIYLMTLIGIHLIFQAI